MKKTVLIYIICFLVLIEIAHSALIEIGIPEDVKGNISSINYDNSSNIVKFTMEFYNTGSVGYKARIKISVFDGDNLIFNGWSHENSLMPGERKTFDIFWYNNNTGNYFAKIRVYFGNEVIEYDKFEFSIDKFLSPEDIFEVRNFRTYDDYIIFDVQSKENVKDIVIMPDQYVSGWIFEQKEIPSIAKDGSKLVIIRYYPTLWKPTNIKILIASDKGRYYSERKLEMEKKNGLAWIFYYLIDKTRITLFL